jgi:hypothetical protein
MKELMKPRFLKKTGFFVFGKSSIEVNKLNAFDLIRNIKMYRKSAHIVF